MFFNVVFAVVVSFALTSALPEINVDDINDQIVGELLTDFLEIIPFEAIPAGVSSFPKLPIEIPTIPKVSIPATSSS